MPAVLLTGRRAYCYKKLAISSLVMATTIGSTHSAYPQNDGQVKLAWVAWYNTRDVVLVLGLGLEGQVLVDMWQVPYFYFPI